MSTGGTASPEEIARFQALADAWWDPDGAFRPLHQFNPPRLEFLRETLLAHFGRDGGLARPFEGLSLLDVGCGGGLLCEPLARLGFAVTGIDAGEKNVEAARRHAEQAGVAVAYRCAVPEDLEGLFDVVLAMEVVEHVPDVGAFLTAAAARVRPGGAFVAATLNRTAKSFALAVVGAEYVMRWLPRGTHDWRRFVRPSELAAALRRAGLDPRSFSGMRYDPLRTRWSRTRSLDVNYMVFAVKAPE